MAIQVSQSQQKPDEIKSMIPMAAGLINPKAGQTAGAVLGADQQSSSPVQRRMQTIQEDPVTQLRAGKTALAGMSSEDRAIYTPYLDEALKRAKMDRTGVA